MADLVPELTVNLDGVFWHRVDRRRHAGEPAALPCGRPWAVQHQLEEMARTGTVPSLTFR
jgi:hypothetical protein